MCNILCPVNDFPSVNDSRLVTVDRRLSTIINDVSPPAIINNSINTTLFLITKQLNICRKIGDVKKNF